MCLPRARAVARSPSSPAASSGEPFVYSELVVGTWGGRPVSDGNDGLANPCASMANIPVEVAETDWPILIERYGLVADSGGAGRYRGGLAVERVWRALVPDTVVHVRSDRQVHRPYGLAGGGEGGGSSDIDPPDRRHARADAADVRRDYSSPATCCTTGCRAAAGSATRVERDRAALARDLQDEKVSAAAARELYGVEVEEVAR